MQASIRIVVEKYIPRNITVIKRVKQSRYRPGVAKRVPGS
jgi:hypothetical protein